jgi:hypothetical protein
MTCTIRANCFPIHSLSPCERVVDDERRKLPGSLRKSLRNVAMASVCITSRSVSRGCTWAMARTTTRRTPGVHMSGSDGSTATLPRNVGRPHLDVVAVGIQGKGRQDTCTRNPHGGVQRRMIRWRRRRRGVHFVFGRREAYTPFPASRSITNEKHTK